MIKTYEEAKNKLLTFSLDEECQSFFEKNNYLQELAYCKVFAGKPAEAENLFTEISDLNPRARWGCKLTGILLNKPVHYPTYFELRNFLEVDLNLLINYDKGNYADEILSYADSFYSVNPEVYKYIGRVFLNNEVYSYAKFFLERAKNRFYHDPELHVILAQLAILEEDYERALKAVDACLEILPEYFPAKDLKRKLTKSDLKFD